jgi:hypothetical protein
MFSVSTVITLAYHSRPTTGRLTANQVFKTVNAYCTVPRALRSIAEDLLTLYCPQLRS